MTPVARRIRYQMEGRTPQEQGVTVVGHSPCHWLGSRPSSTALTPSTLAADRPGCRLALWCAGTWY